MTVRSNTALNTNTQSPQGRIWDILGRSTRSLAYATLLSAALLGTAQGQIRDPQDDNWVATWGASPSHVTPPAVPIQVNDQTIRQIARISQGGDRVRVRFENTFGTASLVIGAARVAVHSSGSGIAPETDRVLTFGGSTSIVVPPGAPAVSDPVDLDVPPLTELAVSIYLPEQVTLETVHGTGRQTTYFSPPGDFTGATTIPLPTTIPMTTVARYILAAIDIRADDKTWAIVTLGNSITDGTNSTVDANRRWPDRLAERLLDRRRPQNRSVVNEGISGNRVLHTFTGPSALARFDRDVVAQTGVAFVVLLEGINDIRSTRPGEAVTADQIIQGYRQLIARAHAKELKIIGGTLLPNEGEGAWTPEGEEKRQAVNAWIRSSGEFDEVIDFDRVVRDPAHPTRILPLYDSGDHLHPNDAGYKAMADAIDLSIFRQRYSSRASLQILDYGRFAELVH